MGTEIIVPEVTVNTSDLASANFLLRCSLRDVLDAQYVRIIMLNKNADE
jgi:hypothetical protein